jgi:hypothetical protein
MIALQKSVAVPWSSPGTLISGVVPVGCEDMVDPDTELTEVVLGPGVDVAEFD